MQAITTRLSRPVVDPGCGGGQRLRARGRLVALVRGHRDPQASQTLELRDHRGIAPVGRQPGQQSGGGGREVVHGLQPTKRPERRGPA
ncbi:MAG: hypothetical protein M0T77_02685, partial [Actinomycetota bacterium]|nr:hypothetical protein [Actinomycetota bacterium]